MKAIVLGVMRYVVEGTGDAEQSLRRKASSLALYGLTDGRWRKALTRASFSSGVFDEE